MCYNVLKSCATRVCCACGDPPICVAVQYLTLRTGCEKHGRKNPLPFSFSKRSHIGNLRQIKKQGKGRSSKRKGNRRCPFLFARRRGYGVVPAAGRGTVPAVRRRRIPAEVQRKTPRPLGANPLTQFARPVQPVLKKVPPVRVNRLRGSSTLLSRCRKRCRPSGANTPAAVRAPRSAGAEFTNRNFRHFRR